MQDWFRRALIQRQLVSEDALDKVLFAFDPAQRLIPDRLFREGLISAKALASLYREAGAQDVTDELAAALPPREVLDLFTRELAEATCAIPMAREGHRLVVGVLDPSDPDILERMVAHCGFAVVPQLVRADVLYRSLQAAYGTELPASLRAMEPDDWDAPPAPAVTEEEVTGEILVRVVTEARPSRDNVPAKYLPRLVPPFRTAIFFAVRDDVAIGWAGAGGGVDETLARSLVFPLSAPSVIAEAWNTRRVATSARPGSFVSERVLLRELSMTSPHAMAVFPLRAGHEIRGLVLVESADQRLAPADITRSEAVIGELENELNVMMERGGLFGPNL